MYLDKLLYFQTRVYSSVTWEIQGSLRPHREPAVITLPTSAPVLSHGITWLLYTEEAAGLRGGYNA